MGEGGKSGGYRQGEGCGEHTDPRAGILPIGMTFNFEMSEFVTSFATIQIHDEKMMKYFGCQLTNT